MIRPVDIDRYFVIQDGDYGNGISSQISIEFGVESEKIKHITPSNKNSIVITNLSTITRLPVKPELRITYQKIIEESIDKGYNYIAVLAGDLIFSNEIKNIKRFLNHIPDDWEIISMGGCWHYAPEPLINEYVAKYNHSLNEPALIINSSAFSSFLQNLDSKDERKHKKKIKYYGPTKDLLWKISMPYTTNIYSVLEPNQISDFINKIYLRNPSHQYAWMSCNKTIHDYTKRISNNNCERVYKAKFPGKAIPVRRQGYKLLETPEGGCILANELGNSGIKITPITQALWDCLDGSTTIHDLEKLIDPSNSHSSTLKELIHENLHALWSNHLVSFKKAHSNAKISVSGLKRCGNHAIIHWLLSNLNFGLKVHIPAPYDSMTNRDGTVRFFNNIDQWMALKSDVSLQSLEDKSIREISAITSEYCGKNLLILRDPLNMLASRLKGEGINYRHHKKILNLWIEYAREYIRETTSLDISTISYNEWLLSRSYRDKICRILEVVNYDKTGYVSASGRGSSFIGVNKDAANNYLNRYRMITFPESYNELFRNDELVHLSNLIFPEIDIAKFISNLK